MADSEPPSLVLDTSVWINLLSTGRASQIVEAIGSPIYVPEQVLGELKLDPVTRRPFPPGPHPALASDHVRLVSLSGNELDIFVELVGAAAPDRLGDGEAASIAIALNRNCRLGVDERKANRIIRERFGSIEMFRSTDILTHSSLSPALGLDVVLECYELAAKYGRMHIAQAGGS